MVLGQPNYYHYECYCNYYYCNYYYYNYNCYNYLILNIYHLEVEKELVILTFEVVAFYNNDMRTVLYYK
jgi:hypothetical protein